MTPPASAASRIYPALRLAPPASPLEMVPQDFSAPHRAAHSGPAQRRADPAALRRVFLLAGCLGTTAAAVSVMAWILSSGGLGATETVLLGIYGVLFFWIAFSALSAIAGAMVLWRRPSNAAWEPQPVILTRTALLLPTYNEDPGRVLSAIQAMCEALEAQGVAEMYDVFLLSDTRDAAIAADEAAGVLRLRMRLGSQSAVYYRRREHNTDRKAGNIADWVRTWGGAYESMVVLDADSLMGAATLVRLTAAMERDPSAGLIQTLPTLIGAQTLFGRLHQFAARLYGPLVAAGQDWWSGAEGNYWGHNAIIRTRAFAETAGLPHLKRAGPFSGAIMSHDFVEAALLRRAGWTVRMAADLPESFEEHPPSLLDMAVRDRRWCQGNLQHLAVLGVRGLHWVSRLHLARGILAYLTAPMWLAFLVLGGAIWATSEVQPPPQALQAGAGISLVTLGLLLAPRIMGGLLALRAGLGHAFGGGGRLLASVILEAVFCSLCAPVLMLLQSRAVLEVVAGRDAGWATQRRDDGAFSLGEAWRRHRIHTLAGAALGLAAGLVDPMLFALTSPVWAGLLVSAPLSALTSRPDAGAAARRAGLFVTPEESRPTELAARMAELRAAYAREAGLRAQIRLLMRGPTASYDLGQASTTSVTALAA